MVPARRCSCPSCPEPAVADDLCSAHANLVASFGALLSSPSPVGFDVVRDRWARGYWLLCGR